MFKRTLQCCGISPFALFLSKSKSHQALKGLSITERGRKCAELYRALSDSELEALRAEAQSASYMRKPPKKEKVHTGRVTAWNRFVRENMEKQKALGGKCNLREISVLWKAAQKGRRENVSSGTGKF